MSFPPPRPPIVPGMFMGVPPAMNMSMPPPPMMGMPPTAGPPPGAMPFFQGVRPGMPPNNLSNQNPMMRMPSPMISKPPSNTNNINPNKPPDHPLPIPQPKPAGPPVTVFVGNITEKWPDPMIRQLLATCGQVLNWKRVQGASGKLQGFGFCEFAGPDAGLRAVRLLDELEVGDKKLVVKVDAKTGKVLDDFKDEKKKKKLEEQNSITKGEGNNADDKEDNDQGTEDYMDKEMRDGDKQSKTRIGIIFREFKNEFDQSPASSESKEDKNGDASSNGSGASKQQIQERLHLLKLSSLEKTQVKEEDTENTDELAIEEGKREIITREISIFRENMKHEKEKEEERKRYHRERREREKERERQRERDRDRDKDDKSRKDRGIDDLNSPDRDRRSPGGRRDRDDHRSSRGGRDNDRDRRDRGNRNRRSRSRSYSPSRGREGRARSPGRTRTPPPKPRYREREEEEEAAEQRRLEKKARDRESAYEERLKNWELREQAKARDLKKSKERQKRQEEEMIKNAKRMKQFLEDYDDEKHDGKYYRGKELQKRLAERARELEADNKDRQREREELEEMKLRMLASSSATPNTTASSTPTRLFERYKKPLIESNSTQNILSTSQPSIGKISLEPKRSPIASRFQSIALNSFQPKPIETPTLSLSTSISMNRSPHQFQPVVTTGSSTTSVTPISFGCMKSSGGSNISTSSFPTSKFSDIPVKKEQTTNAPITTPNGSDASLKKEEDESRQSFSSPLSSGGGLSPGCSNDVSPAQNSPDILKKKKIDVKDVFNQDDDDDGMGAAKKRKLIPLDYDDEFSSKRAKIKEEKKDITEDKKKHIKTLIERIPTGKDDLFSYEIDWSMVDNSLMEKRIRPWINKKIVEYIGEPEPTLVEFICSKVLGQSAPQSILEDVMMVLDEEAEIFVVKMWRLLVYEIEAKKFGVTTGKPQ